MTSRTWGLSQFKKFLRAQVYETKYNFIAPDAAVLRPSVVVVCLYGFTECIVAKQCVLEQKSVLTTYRNSYMRNRLAPNEWPWPLFRGSSKVMSTLRYIRRWISRKPSEIEAWLIQRTTNRKWHYGVSNSYVSDDVTWPLKVLWGSTVGYPNDSLASCYVYWRRRALHAISITQHNLVRVQTVETDELTHISVITRVWDWRFLKNMEIA